MKEVSFVLTDLEEEIMVEGLSANSAVKVSKNCQIV